MARRAARAGTRSAAGQRAILGYRGRSGAALGGTGGRAARVAEGQRAGLGAGRSAQPAAADALVLHCIR